MLVSPSTVQAAEHREDVIVLMGGGDLFEFVLGDDVHDPSVHADRYQRGFGRLVDVGGLRYGRDLAAGKLVPDVIGFGGSWSVGGRANE